MFCLFFLEADNAQQQHGGSKKKLHRTLYEILNDRTTLSFFVQYLESKSGLPLVKFWLDVETFRSVGGYGSDSLSERTESRFSNYDGTISNKRERERKGNGDFDCVSISTTATSNTSNFDETDEINGDDEIDRAVETATTYENERMTHSLTDDEKFKICEKNRTTKADDIEAKSQQSQPTIILEDALRIYRKYLVIDSIYSLELPATILAKLSLALCGSDPETDVDLNNLWLAFEEAQKHVYDVMEREFLAEFLDSTFYTKYMIDVLTSDSLCLEEILCSESALFYFMEFLEQDKETLKLPRIAYLEFWLSASNFRKQFVGFSDEKSYSETLQSDALVIYEKWFSLQATSPLNFSNRIRTRVEELICSGVSSCFDVPIMIVELFLERNCLKRFIKSQLFFKHLAEMMSKVDQNNEQKEVGIIRRNSTHTTNGHTINNKVTNKHRRTNSESVKISTQNTLLAGLDYSHKRKTDLQIDSRQILDPDMLWRRKNSTTKLSFGRIDEFGRYERDFEMPTINSQQIPSSKSFPGPIVDVDDTQSIFEQARWSSLKNAVRKLVHLPEDSSVQQEIAWQVAEMIIKDVTSITLHSNNENE